MASIMLEYLYLICLLCLTISVPILIRGCFSIHSQMPAQGGAISERIDKVADLLDEMADIIKQHRPTVAALEGVFSHGKFPRSALILGHARGVCLLECRREHLPIATIAPAEMKRVIAGSGRATKAQVQRAVAAWCGLQKPPEPNDAADALGMALFQLRKLTPHLRGSP